MKPINKMLGYFPIKKSAMTSLLIFFLISIIHASTGAQTLLDYMALAVDSNAGLKAKYNDYLASLEKVPQVTALSDPEVSFGYFISPIETRTGAQEARISAVQMFPWFGTLGAKESVSVEVAKAKYDLFEQSRNDLIFLVKETYYSLYEVQKSIQIAKRNLKIWSSFESLATTKFETGAGSLADILRIQMEIAELENTLSLLEDKMKPFTSRFNQYLNRESSTLVALPDTLEADFVIMNKTILTDSIINQNEKLKSIRHMESASEYAIKVARKMGSPSIGLGINYIVISERPDVSMPDNGKDAFMPLISLKIPIYRGKYTAQKREANLENESWKNRRLEQENALQTQLEFSWVNYEDAGRRILLYQQQIKIAKKTQDILLESYSTNGKDFEEILRIQRMLLNYELQLIKAVKDNNTAVAVIETLY